MSTSKRKLDRASYYARNIFRDSLLPVLFQRRLRPILEGRVRYDRDELASRVNYYNKLSAPFTETEFRSRVGRIPIEGSLYYYDLKEHARYFSRRLRLNFKFGDITAVPERPSFVKSRPISGDNQNSIVMKLDKFRHYYFPADPVPFAEKKPMAVWRGWKNNPKRAVLVSRYKGHPLCDVGFAERTGKDGEDTRYLSEIDQLQFRYVISIEGVDVATNLKWIMGSNSLCLMPAPVFETWFMEGRLEAGKHFVLLQADFADVEEKITYFERHPDEARAIVANANRYAA
ncbi:MAG TPA: glycosyl transferase family 90, partial [Fimbriimonadaceae bacterium]|nr:glycosyl transferase family 90 [Fimbriimonadaceae bacterium]